MARSLPRGGSSVGSSSASRNALLWSTVQSVGHSFFLMLPVGSNSRFANTYAISRSFSIVPIRVMTTYATLTSWAFVNFNTVPVRAAPSHPATGSAFDVASFHRVPTSSHPSAPCRRAATPSAVAQSSTPPPTRTTDDVTFSLFLHAFLEPTFTPVIGNRLTYGEFPPHCPAGHPSGLIPEVTSMQVPMAGSSAGAKRCAASAEASRCTPCLGTASVGVGPVFPLHAIAVAKPIFSNAIMTFNVLRIQAHLLAPRPRGESRIRRSATHPRHRGKRRSP